MPPSEIVSSPGLISVNLDALARNYETLRGAAEPGRCGAVVKADAYGLGMAPVAATLHGEGCRDFFVANVTEGERLRAQLDDTLIYVLAGIEPGAAARVRAARLVPVLNSLPQVHEWLDAGATSDDPVIVQVDTGMSRLGMSQAEVEVLAADPGLLARLDIAYVATHFACADEPAHPLNAQQRTRFDTLRGLLPTCPVCVDNSASVLDERLVSGDLVRPGIALYGGNPFVDRANPIEIVVEVSSPILQVRDVLEPISVGYGATHDVTPPARLATLGVGYADGYPRALGNCASVSVAGHDAPVVGRISMDLTTIDVTGLPDELVVPGALVELIGTHVSLDDVAAAAGTISYEILSGLGVRWQRRYVGDRATRLGLAQ